MFGKFEAMPNNTSLNRERREDKYEKNDQVFDEQFNAVKKIDNIDTVNIEAKEPSEKNKIVFAPGFSRTPATFKNMMREFYEKNRSIASLSHPRIMGEVGDNPSEQELPKEVLRRATSLSKILFSEIEENEKNNSNNKIDIVGQSAGGIDAILAAAMVEEEKPGFISNIVIVDPAGIVGKDSSEELKGRFKDQVTDNLAVLSDGKDPNGTISLSTVENQVTAKKEFFKYLLKNPLRAQSEIKGMTAVKLEELILELKKSSNIGISIIHGVDDKTFPMEMVQRGAKNRGLSKGIDGFYSVKGGHNELYLNPDKYVGVVDMALTALEAKKSRKN